MTDLVSIATYDKIVSFSEHATNKFQTGKISYEQFCNIEMMDLGYNPNNPKEVEEYLNFIDDLKDELRTPGYPHGVGKNSLLRL